MAEKPQAQTPAILWLQWQEHWEQDLKKSTIIVWAMEPQIWMKIISDQLFY
jgi:hypothetical protein